MVIKVSTLLAHSTVVEDDSAPTLGGPLNTNGFPIVDGGNPVTITGNEYPINSGSAGQVLTTNGLGVLYWNTVTGTGTVTSVGLTSSGNTISVSGLPNPITNSGTFNIDLPLSGVTHATYGSASSVSVFTVNPEGIITTASNVSIAITPSQAGLGNVTNSIQVVNNGNAPSIQESTGVPSGTATTGAIYIDQSATNGNTIYYYNGTSWISIANSLKLYNENWTAGYVPPSAIGTNSVAIGEGAQTDAKDSLAIGLQSLTRLQGGVVQASGRFANTGDAQTGKYLVRNITTNNAPTILYIDGVGGSQQLLLTDNSTWTFRIMITGHQTSAGNGHAGYEFSGVIYRMAGASTTAIQGKISKSIIAESNTPWDANIVADIVNGALQITVSGEIGKIIRWVALVETVEITN